jgi:DNA invertase Pin-like site-specific DNA recombinase
MKIGYARVSTTEQTTESQVALLKEAGCVKIFEDVISGSKAERKGLKECLAYARAGDGIVIYKLDRLGRSLKELLILIDDLKKREITLIILSQNIDTSTNTGKLMLQLFGMIAEFERDLIRERTMAGLKSARARGKVGGRRYILNASQTENLKLIHGAGKTKNADICEMFGIKISTLHKYLNR